MPDAYDRGADQQVRRVAGLLLRSEEADAGGAARRGNGAGQLRDRAGADRDAGVVQEAPSVCCADTSPRGGSKTRKEIEMKAIIVGMAFIALLEMVVIAWLIDEERQKAREKNLRDGFPWDWTMELRSFLPSWKLT